MRSAEQHHISSAFGVLRDHNFLLNLPKPDYIRLRKVGASPLKPSANICLSPTRTCNFLWFALPGQLPN